MNIGAVITGPMEDPDWMKKLLKVSGLTFLVCITIVGIFVAIPNLLGWSKLVTEARLRGDKTLPEFSFGNIGEGWRIFIGSFVYGLIAALAFIPLMIVFGGLSFVAGKIAAPLAVVISLVGVLVYLAVALLVGLSSPIISGRIILDGDTMAGTGIVGALKLARENLGTCAMFLVSLIALQIVVGIVGAIPLVGALFMILCGIGYTSAAQGIALAQFRESGIR